MGITLAFPFSAWLSLNGLPTPGALPLSPYPTFVRYITPYPTSLPPLTLFLPLILIIVPLSYPNLPNRVLILFYPSLTLSPFYSHSTGTPGTSDHVLPLPQPYSNPTLTLTHSTGTPGSTDPTQASFAGIPISIPLIEWGGWLKDPQNNNLPWTTPTTCDMVS